MTLPVSYMREGRGKDKLLSFRVNIRVLLLELPNFIIIIKYLLLLIICIFIAPFTGRFTHNNRDRTTKGNSVWRCDNLTALTCLYHVLDDGDHLNLQVSRGGALHSDQPLLHQSLNFDLQLPQGLGASVLVSLSLSLPLTFQLSLSFSLLQKSHLGAGLT